jgi:O-antigen/teichoic acid export membrane protein
LKKQFVINLILLVVLNLLIKPFWVFGIEREVQNLVGAEQYGFYFSLFNFSILMNMLLDMGITNYNQRHIARDHNRLKSALSGFIGMKLMLSLVYVVFGFAVGYLIGYDWNQLYLLAFLLINQVFISFIQYWRSNISGLHLFITDSLLSVLDKSLMIIICSILLFIPSYRNQFEIEWFVYGQTIAYAVAWCVAALVVLYHSGKLKIQLNWKESITTIRKTAPYALLVLLMALYNRIDSVMLERMLPDGKAQAGIYAQAFRILDAGAMFGVLFAGLLLPMFSRMLKKNEAVTDLLRLASKLIIMPALAVWCVSHFYSHPISDLLYHNHVVETSKLLPVLMGSFVFICTSYIFGTLLTANGSLKALNQMAAAGLLLNIILNWIFIPKMQALGAAYTSFATQGATAIMQLLIAIRIFRFSINWSLIVRLMVFAILIFGISYFTTSLENWGYSLMVIIVSGLLFSFLLQLLNMKELLSFLSKTEK